MLLEFDDSAPTVRSTPANTRALHFSPGKSRIESPAAGRLNRTSSSPADLCLELVRNVIGVDWQAINVRREMVVGLGRHVNEERLFIADILVSVKNEGRNNHQRTIEVALDHLADLPVGR